VIIAVPILDVAPEFVQTASSVSKLSAMAEMVSSSFPFEAYERRQGGFALLTVPSNNDAAFQSAL
jgi:hypothetical protein